MVRELVRRIQLMRKEAGFTRVDTIMLYANVDEVTKKLIQKNKDEIKKTVKAKGITFSREMPRTSKKDWDIAGDKIEFGITKA